MDYKDVLSGQIKDNFWSMAKRDLINLILQQHAPISRYTDPPKILNIGAGVGDDLSVISEYGRVYVVDIDNEALKLIRDNNCVEKRLASINALPYPAETFDIVTCFDVFEHVEEDRAAFQEIHRVLKIGGLLVFTVPAFQALYSGHDRALKHVRRYDYKEILHRVTGLKIVFLSYWNCILFGPISVWRILRKNSIPREDLVSFSRILNLFLFWLLHIENKILQHNLKLPFGLSIFGICERKRREIKK
jgi:SAM-dependent methyltransferase